MFVARSGYCAGHSIHLGGFLHKKPPQSGPPQTPAHLKYLVVSFCPRITGVVPTDFCMIQAPLEMWGMSLNCLLRARSASGPSPLMKLRSSDEELECARHRIGTGWASEGAH